MRESSKIYNSSLLASRKNYPSEMGNFISSSGVYSRTVVQYYTNAKPLSVLTSP